jgi:hypothetical protein
MECYHPVLCTVCALVSDVSVKLERFEAKAKQCHAATRHLDINCFCFLKSCACPPKLLIKERRTKRRRVRLAVLCAVNAPRIISQFQSTDMSKTLAGVLTEGSIVILIVLVRLEDNDWICTHIPAKCSWTPRLSVYSCTEIEVPGASKQIQFLLYSRLTISDVPNGSIVKIIGFLLVSEIPNLLIFKAVLFFTTNSYRFFFMPQEKVNIISVEDSPIRVLKVSCPNIVKAVVNWW